MRLSSLLPPLLSLTPATAALLPRAAVNDWVTIDPSGSPHTLTPSVTTSDGAVRTLSGAPYRLTGSVFTISSDDALTTSTGSPPPPEASATDGAGGLFAVCHNRVGKDGPFCEPRAGSDLSIGRTYYGGFPSFYSLPQTCICLEGRGLGMGVGVLGKRHWLMSISSSHLG